MRGLSFFLRLGFNFLGVLVTRKEVENGEVKRKEELRLGLRILWVWVLVRKRRQAIEFSIRGLICEGCDRFIMWVMIKR